MMDVRTVNVMRYITPMREGGSLPALAEADDDFKYVVKFRGAGHGTKALVSEMLGGLIAKQLGLKVPELVFINLGEAFGRTEGDEEIQELLKKSEGLNMGLQFLSPAYTFDPVTSNVNNRLASQIVWLDAYITNIDRTVRNTNMLIFNRELWLIDHGASFYFHHAWKNIETATLTPFHHVKDHVLLPYAFEIDEVDREFRTLLEDTTIDNIVDTLPDDWLNWTLQAGSPDEIRTVYREFLKTRRDNSHLFVKEANDARNALI